MSAADNSDIVLGWIKAGLIPDGARRVIIDMRVNYPTIIYCEAIADDRMFDIDMTAALRGAEVITTKESEDARPNSPDPTTP